VLAPLVSAAHFPVLVRFTGNFEIFGEFSAKNQSCVPQKSTNFDIRFPKSKTGKLLTVTAQRILAFREWKSPSLDLLFWQ
jgi:hypothetical protein